MVVRKSCAPAPPVIVGDKKLARNRRVAVKLEHLRVTITDLKGLRDYVERA